MLISLRKLVLLYVQNKEEFLGHLPRVNVKQEFHDDYYLCRELRHRLKDSEFSASCAMPPQDSRSPGTDIDSGYYNTRELREAAAVSLPRIAVVHLPISVLMCTE